MPGKFRKTHVVHYTHIAWYAHFVHIETLGLDFRPDAKADDYINQFENDESEGSNHDYVGADADTFRNKLRCVAVEQAADRPRNSVPTIAIRSVRQQTESPTAPRSVYTVDGDRTDRIINLKALFNEQSCLNHKNARDNADQTGAWRVNECAGRRDCHKTG